MASRASLSLQYPRRGSVCGPLGTRGTCAQCDSTPCAFSARPASGAVPSPPAKGGLVFYSYSQHNFSYFHLYTTFYIIFIYMRLVLYSIYCSAGEHATAHKLSSQNSSSGIAASSSHKPSCRGSDRNGKCCFSVSIPFQS